jgi:O-antigen/teichoic acid export membrane protein
MMELIRATFPAVRPAWLAALWARFGHEAALRSMTSLLDQVAASGTNFLATIIIGRACLPEELGLYSLGFSLVITLSSLPRALIWTPYTTFLPRMADDERRLYSASALVQMMLLCAVLGLGVSASGIGVTKEGLGALLIVLGPAGALMLLREHIRQVCFSRLKAGEALLVDVAVGVLQTTGLFLLAYNGALSAVRAYLVIAIATAPAAAAWILSNRSTLTFRRSGIRAHFHRNWGFARWILGGALVAGFTSAVTPWALSLLHGPAAAGVLAAAYMVTNLINPLILGYSNFFAAHASHVYAKAGAQALVSVVMRAALLMAALAGAFTLGVALWGEEFVTLVFGQKYAGQGAIVTVVMLSEAIAIVTLPLGLGLMAAGRGDIFLRAHLARMVLTMTVGLWCIYQFGAMGAAYSVVAGSIGACLWQWLAFRSLVPDPAEARA